MKKYKKARKMAVILASVLVMDSYMGAVSPYINAYAYTEKAATVNATTLNVRSGPGTTYSVVTKLTNGASVTVIDEKNASDGALWYQIRVSGSGGQTVTGYVSKSYLKFPASYTNDADFESRLTAEGFPESYKTKLRALHAQYPKWVFRAQHTNLDWNTAIKEESQVGKTLVHTNSLSSWKSTVDGAYNWDTSTWIGYDGSSWVTASEDIVRYYMDPRNFLDETNIFQFMTHTYDSNKHTAEGLKTMVKGTFLSGESSGGSSNSGNTDSSSGDGTVIGPGAAIGPGGATNPGAGSESNSDSGKVSLEGPQASITPKNLPIVMEYGPGASLTGPSSSDTNSNATGTVSGSSAYVNMIMNAASQSGVNPYVLAAMIIQEQGSSGTGKSISGTESGYAGYYNFFNIEAYQSGTMTAVQRGLWWASQSGNYERPWNSPEKSILGGAFYYGNNYVKVGQDTFYLKKFNVQGSNLYKHQYMTNVQGAASEGAVYSKAYNSDMKQTELEFKIPIYNNMPDNACSQPTGDGNPNNKLSGLSVEGFVMTPTFSRDTLAYDLIVDPGVSSINVNATALSSLASVKGTGTIALSSGNNDIKVTITAQNGSVREYVLHVVRQNNGPTYSSGAGTGTSSGSGGNASSGPGSNTGPGVSNPSGTDHAGTPGGSNVSIAPDGSTGISVQTSTGVIAQGPGTDIKVTEAATSSPQQIQAPAAGQSSAFGIGDINGDGKINSLDVLKLQRYLLGLETIPEQGKLAADLNGDGKVNSQDLLLLQKKILGL
ncbi:dockerin type I domain-containing protein [Lacrimispora sp.]|uniref:dockerin type I domain-containing protein n=1 Tax=Lacrimispora sp. TaxID=2719234 RepID=UPI0028AFF9BE|nr:dockerin type I domain-containing protein [Lacrimispora sp.]